MASTAQHANYFGKPPEKARNPGAALLAHPSQGHTSKLNLRGQSGRAHEDRTALYVLAEMVDQAFIHQRTIRHASRAEVKDHRRAGLNVRRSLG